MMEARVTAGGPWNKAKIKSLLERSDKAVCRAMEVLYDRQTLDEKQTSETRHSNRMGFRAGGHAVSGSYFGRWVKSGRKLTGRHLEKARSIALHYTQQLADVANAKDTAAKASKPKPTMPDSMSSLELLLRTQREPGDESEWEKRAARNIAEGRCADGCCGGDD